MSATTLIFFIEKIHKKLVQETLTLISKSASVIKATQSLKTRFIKIVISVLTVSAQVIKAELFKREKACKKKRKL